MRKIFNNGCNDIAMPPILRGPTFHVQQRIARDKSANCGTEQKCWTLLLHDCPDLLDSFLWKLHRVGVGNCSYTFPFPGATHCHSAKHNAPSLCHSLA